MAYGFSRSATARTAGTTSRMAWLESPIAEVGPSRAARLRRHRPHLDVTTEVVEGDPKDVILRKATEWHAGRVVLGSHGYGPVGRAVLGSTAAAVAAEAPCSVVIPRPAPSGSGSGVTLIRTGRRIHTRAFSGPERRHWPDPS